MTRWECYRCSFEVEGENPPEECPNCHYSISFWINQTEQKQLTLKDFVRTDLLKLDGNQSVWEAAKLMKEHDTENVLVTIDGVPSGLVTEKDVLRKVAAEDLPASKVLLRKVMSSPLVTASMDTLVTEALRIMASHHIQRLIVTDGGKPIGVVSHRSVLGGSFRAAGQVSVTQEPMASF